MAMRQIQPAGTRSPGLIQRYQQELQARHYSSNAFLTHLAVDLDVSASTQNQALSALVFLFRERLERDLALEGVVRARTKR